MKRFAIRLRIRKAFTPPSVFIEIMVGGNWLIWYNKFKLYSKCLEGGAAMIVDKSLSPAA